MCVKEPQPFHYPAGEWLDDLTSNLYNNWERIIILIKHTISFGSQHHTDRQKMTIIQSELSPSSGQKAYRILCFLTCFW